MTDHPESTSVKSTDTSQAYAREQELRLLRARLAQREAAIIELNRRLRQLEQQRPRVNHYPISLCHRYQPARARCGGMDLYQ